MIVSIINNRYSQKIKKPLFVIIMLKLYYFVIFFIIYKYLMYLLYYLFYILIKKLINF